ncbi:MAG: NfeD family protein, partial [Oxalobacteraceae bacterium]
AAAALSYGLIKIFALQMTIAAIVGAITIFLLRKSSFAKKRKLPAARDPNVNLDIGQTVYIAQWQGNQARAMYRGAMWDIELMPDGVAVAGTFIIDEIRGSHLIVTNTAA